MTQTFHFSNLQETKSWAEKFVLDVNRPCVVLLKGEMGAGKTQLVRWFLSALGFDKASSPTFAIHQVYKTKNGNVDHVDLYRLKNSDELDATGFWDLLEQKDGLVFVEWPEKAGPVSWPANWKKIEISISRESSSLEARTLLVRDF